MARLMTRPRPRFSLHGLVLLSFLAGPAASQTPSATLDVTVTPTGTWDADGFLDARNETATWSIVARVTFSATAGCLNGHVFGNFTLLPDAAFMGSFRVEPTSAELEVPAGGGTTPFAGNITVDPSEAARAGTAYAIKLNTKVSECSAATGTTPEVETNNTLTTEILFRAGLRVDWEPEFTTEGVFNFTYTNTGNGPLAVTVSARPVEGAPDQPTTITPASFPLGAGEFNIAVIKFPEKRAGAYDILTSGAFDGPGSEERQKANHVARVEIRERETIEVEKDSPGLGVLLSLLGAIASLAWFRRRARL